ncbi:MAG: hypothetical protein OHK0038_04520 [Flammeovirgaceae bacterium]
MASTLQTLSQSPLFFEKDSIYIGSVDKSQSPFIQSFHFKVLSEVPIMIEEVISDCGCVVAEYPHQELKPQEKNNITLAFKPYRDGAFLKIVEVKVKDYQEPIYLKLTGYVTGFYVSKEVEFPHVTGNLRWKMKGIHFGTITDKEVVKKEVEFYNAGNKPITFSDSVIFAPYLEIDFGSSREVKAKSKGKFTLFYHPEKRKEYGYVLDNIWFKTNDILAPQIQIPVTASIKPYTQESFSDKTPKLLVSSENLDLGKIVLPRDETIYFEIQNVGEMPLEIKKVLPNYGCQVMPLQKTILSQNEKTLLIVKILDLGKEGRQERSLTLFSNDPVQSAKVLSMKMYVVGSNY